jgi:hypothetical protein
MSPLLYQPEPHGAAESEAYDALLGAGFALHTRHGQIGPVAVCFRRASRGAYRTRTHRSFRALLRQAQQDGQL